MVLHLHVGGRVESLIKDRHYLWNSGIFMFKASVVLKALEKFEPKLTKTCKDSLKNGVFDLDFFRVNEENFRSCPNIPFDIAVMEKTNIGRVIKFDAGWDDIEVGNLYGITLTKIKMVIR